MSEELYTNKVVAIRKAARRPNAKAREALAAKDAQTVLDCLTGKQRAFVEEYLKDLNGREAVLRAGYRTNNPKQLSSNMLKSPNIRLAVDALKVQRAKNSDVTKDYVLKKMVKTLEKAEEEGNHNVTLRAAELLAKHLGMFIDRTEISGPDGHAIEVERRTKEEADSFLDLLDRTAKKDGSV